MTKKKTNSYVKIVLHMLLGALFGGILGFSFYWFFGNKEKSIEATLAGVMSLGQSVMLPALILILIVTVIIGEWTIRKLKQIGDEILKAEDEEADVWEYEEERVGGVGLNVSNISQALSMIVLSIGYSSKYIESAASARHGFLISCIVFIVCFGYSGFWQTRFVKQTQKAHPEKQGDPTSRKFQQQWLESCDEAEREVIFQSSYKTYTAMNKWIPSLLVVTMLCNLFFNTGILATFIVTIIWIVMTVTYTHSCVKMKEKKAGKIRE